MTATHIRITSHQTTSFKMGWFSSNHFQNISFSPVVTFYALACFAPVPSIVAIPAPIRKDSTMVSTIGSLSSGTLDIALVIFSARASCFGVYSFMLFYLLRWFSLPPPAALWYHHSRKGLIICWSFILP